MRFPLTIPPTTVPPSASTVLPYLLSDTDVSSALLAAWLMVGLLVAVLIVVAVRR